jgi:hypothetical protein
VGAIMPPESRMTLAHRAEKWTRFSASTIRS